MNKPYWLMYSPKEYYHFRRQTLVNWLDVHTHVGNVDDACLYCNQTGDELWWYLPTCRAHQWHIRNMFSPGGANCFGLSSKHTDNPYRKKDSNEGS